MMHGSNWTRRGFLAAAGTAGVGWVASAAFAQVPLAPPDKQPPNLNVPQLKKRAGWAIVGLGKLALEEIIPAFGRCEMSRPTALISGHRDKAETTAHRYGVDVRNIYNYDNFDTIKDNPDIDVVYIVLPNSMHAEFTIRALKAGKHVLCEKPMAVTAEECRRMIDAAKEADRKLGIAYRLRYEPFHQKAIELIRSGELGKLRLFEAQNAQNVEAPNIRLSEKLGGGPIGDVGIYCLNAARYLSGEEPTSFSATSASPEGDERFREVAGHVTFQMRFPSGLLAMCSCGFDTARSDRLRVVGDKGYLELDVAFSYEGQRLKVFKEGQMIEHKLSPVNHFTAEMDAFSDCVLNNKSFLTPGEEGLRDMVAIEKIRESMKDQGRVVSI